MKKTRLLNHPLPLLSKEGKTTALFIGRFQPFHAGHLDALKQILGDPSTSSRQVIIGVGSSQYSGTDENPYSFAERKKIIAKATSNIKNKNIKIIAIPDIHDPPNWVEHVKKIVGHFDLVYTGNKLTEKLFKDKKYKVKKIKINLKISGTEIRNEASRLFENLQKTCYTYEDCLDIASLTLKINKLKKQQKAIILAHSYQTPDIMYGVADYIGDSYYLSKISAKNKAQKIIFCSVYFMGETAKILNPKKEILVPIKAGCSLADSITPTQVRTLKKEYPDRPVVCYINTSAVVKAECDIICTSANALKVINSLPQNEIIFIPDILMGKNLQKLTKKKLIMWNGTCIVHEKFNPRSILQVKKQFPKAKILAHTECRPEIIDFADLAGSTNDMLNFVNKTKTKDIMMITECGLSDRVRVENPNKNIIGTCNLCPYMKKITLKDVLQTLQKPKKNQIVKLNKEIITKAKKSLERMLTI